MTNEFDDVRRYLHVKLHYYKTLMPETFEDAIQEGLIQAWRDVEDGVEPRLKVLRRAALTAKRFLQRGGEHFYGKPAVSRDGYRRDSTTIEKVQAYLSETVGLRDEWPEPLEVAKALGINRRAAGVALRAIKEGKVDHTVYWTAKDGGRRKDYKYYSTTHLENYSIPGSDSSKNSAWEENDLLAKYLDSTEFDADLISRLDIMETLKKLNDKHRTALYFHLFEGWNTGEIGRYFNYKTNPSQNGAKLLNSALNQFNMLLDPFNGECKNSHSFSPTTTKFVQIKDKTWKRICLSCRKAS